MRWLRTIWDELFGLFVDFLFMAFAPSLAWLYVGRILNGVTAASFSTVGKRRKNSW